MTTKKGSTSKALGHWKKAKKSSSSILNLSDSFLNTIGFKSEKKLGVGFKPVYNLEPVYKQANNRVEDAKATRTRSLSKKRKPMRGGQMGTYLPAETAEEWKARINNDSQNENEFNETDLDKNSQYNRRFHSIESETKPLREDFFEIPSHLVMKFLGHVTHSKWKEAMKLCKRFNALQPNNKIYSEFLIILQAMVIYKDKMVGFDDKFTEASSVTSSKSSYSVETEMVEEMTDLTSQLQMQENDARQ